MVIRLIDDGNDVKILRRKPIHEQLIDIFFIQISTHINVRRGTSTVISTAVMKSEIVRK